ncbi:hypothetical protein J4E91_006556 [Alternaria rosae]|nr:hypothetical protein J4E91_006556 [Alternaria rosae]
MVEIPTIFPEVPSMIQDSSSDIPSFPRTRRAATTGRRSPSSPAPTIYLTGFKCVAGDREYQLARRVTGNVQPYWFEGSQSHRRKDPTRRADRVEDICLDGPSTKRDRRADEKKTQRERDRKTFLETMWPTVREEYYAIFGLTKLSPEQEVRMRDDTRILLEEEWDILEEERRAEKRKRKEQGKTIVRLPIHNISDGRGESEKKFKMKGKAKMKDGSGTETKGDKIRGFSRRLREILHLPARPTPQDPAVAPPFHPIL